MRLIKGQLLLSLKKVEREERNKKKLWRYPLKNILFNFENFYTKYIHVYPTSGYAPRGL